MRALCAFAILVAVGCGGEPPSWSSSFDAVPGEQLSVTAWRGTVRLRNSANGKVEFLVRGTAPLPLEQVVAVTEAGSSPRRVGLVIREAAKDADLAIEIAAPPGASLSCACADAAVDAEGAWGRLVVRTAAGAIRARVQRADSGELESRSGAVLYDAATGPKGEMHAKSVRGDVTIRLPAAWNGQIDCTTRGGRLDVPSHASLRTLWDEDRRHVVGHVGPPPAAREPPRAAPMGNLAEEAWPPLIATVWGSSAHGNVSLRLED